MCASPNELDGTCLYKLVPFLCLLFYFTAPQELLQTSMKYACLIFLVLSPFLALVGEL